MKQISLAESGFARTSKVRYRGLEKNTAQLHTLFACVNLWMARKDLLAAG